MKNQTLVTLVMVGLLVWTHSNVLEAKIYKGG
jgi:hypothetical protein